MTAIDPSPVDLPRRDAPRRDGVSRRQFIGRAGGTALAVGGLGSFLAACGDSDGGGSGDSGDVVVISWVSYVTPEIKKLFEAEYPGITMRGVAAESDADMFTKVSAGGGGQYDIVFANCGWSPAYLEQDLIEPFAPDEVKGAANQMFPIFIEDQSLPYVTDEGLLLFPNAWGANSLVWNLDVPFQPAPPYSWNQLWSDQVPDNKVVMSGAGDDFLAIAGLAKGVPPADAYGMSSTQLKTAEEYLIELKPFQWNKQSDPEFRAAIESKRAWLGLGTTLGSAPILNDEAGKEVAALAIPDEGTVGWVDGPQLVRGAKNRKNALKFMEFFATNPKVLQYMFDEYSNAPCNQRFVERASESQGEDAKRMEQVQAAKPEVAKTIAYQRQPDDPQAYAAAWDRVQAS